MTWNDPDTYLDFAPGEIVGAAKLDRIKENEKFTYYRTVSGAVAADGSVAIGNLFTAVAVGGGTYTVTFTPTLELLPAVIVTPIQPPTQPLTAMLTDYASTSSFTVQFLNTSASGIDVAFYFIAHGIA